MGHMNLFHLALLSGDHTTAMNPLIPAWHEGVGILLLGGLAV